MTQEQYNRLVEWCKVLESNKYKQGMNVLRQYNRYCCLGVAIDLISPDLWEACKERPFENVFTHALGSGAADGNNNGRRLKNTYMSKEAMDLYGLEEEDIKKLTDLNDNCFTFLEISQYIRNNILVRFTTE